MTLPAELLEKILAAALPNRIKVILQEEGPIQDERVSLYWVNLWIPRLLRVSHGFRAAVGTVIYSRLHVFWTRFCTDDGRLLSRLRLKHLWTKATRHLKKTLTGV